ncbi:hypothetical protein [Ohtaekwangia sp.]|uniref:hypothetical protein n=1 Tax=Ohtaekwangia sp. TaxID=2066019 RepID=UPI002F91E72B
MYVMEVKRLKKYFLLLAVLTVGIAAWGHPADSLLVNKKDSVFTFRPATAEAYLFDEPADILEEGMSPVSASNDSIQRYIDLARSLFTKIRETQNFITNIDQASKVELPVGISKSIGGVNYDIAINAIRLKPAYAELDVFLQFEVPQNNQVLTFMARGIKFSKNAGIVGDAKLELLGDYAINFNGDKVQLILKGTSSGQGTYAVMDCDGFRELSLDAEVKFSRDMIRPENANGSVGSGNVQTSFKTVLSGWNDLVVQIDLPPFQVTGLNGVGFSVRDAVFDFSDLRNAPAVVFPAGYQSTQFLPDNPNLWRGFYLRQLTVSLPPELQKKGATTRTSFSAENVLIDNMGITGKFTGTNLIPLNQGDMNGWAFSLDSLSIDLRANQIVQAGFSGGLVIPIGKEDQPFDYSALISTGGNYLFNVSPASNMTFPLWGAGKVQIYDASYLEIKIQDGKFLPKANLHGQMSIAARLSEGGQGVELANITFENLEIQSVKPYIKVGNFSFGSEALQQKMAGFPISINDIGLRSISDTEVGLDFKLKLNLVGESAGSFAADAGLTLVGNMETGKGLQHWKYKEILVNEIGVDIDGGAFKINGRLKFYRNDVMYGDGFNGSVKAEFTPGIKVTANAIFGNVTGMRYWYADAMVNFPSGIPIFTGVGIYGFGGGAYYAMKMDNQGVGSDLGRTSSGVVYVPDSKAGLGLKAIVSIGSYPKPEAFNADVTFEISFFRSGGVRYIALGGNGYLITPGLDLNLDKMKGAANKMVGAVKKLEGQMSDATMGLVKSGGSDNSMTEIFGEIGDKAGQKGQISAKVMIDYDFENSVLHGTFEVFVNVAGGLIKGVGPNGRAGWSVLHFAPHEWYVYVGTPSDRVGISLGVGSIRASATSYFMVGSKILESPPPPEEVTRILGGGDYDYMKDLNALGTGGGFGFGAALSINTGNLSFLMFYAKFEAGLGFDIMLKDYGDVKCKGRSGTLGINGWYANGQAYAYFDGDVGIRVKVFGFKRNISILSIGAAVLLQAQLPNPIWLQGTVGGHFSVLGGLVSGQCKFQVTLGDKCEIEREGSVVEDLKVIAQITPDNGVKDIDVFNAPQAVFNFAVGKSFNLVDIDEQPKSFRVKLEYFGIKDGTREIPGSVEWNESLDVAAFNSFETLPPQKELKSSVQVSFEEFASGIWKPVIVDGKKVVHSMETSFTTGTAPDYIPLNNVAYSYPQINQVNFYSKEYDKAYIKLKKDQPYLFNLDNKWKQKGRFIANGTTTLVDIQYQSGEVIFEVPKSLENGAVYSLELVNMPANTNTSVDKNVSDNVSKVGGDQSVDMEMKGKKAEGTLDILQEKTFFQTHFRTSQYATFAQKINGLQYSPAWRRQIRNYVHELGVTVNVNELFSQSEIYGDNGAKALVHFESILSNNPYYDNQITPLIYEGYPLEGIGTISWRTPEDAGVPPVKDVSYIRQYPSNIVMTDSDVQANTFSFSTNEGALVYNAAHYMEYDFRDIQSRVVNKYINTGVASDRVKTLLLAPFPVIADGTYSVKVKYVLPGKDIVTSEQVIQMTNTIKP